MHRLILPVLVAAAPAWAGLDALATECLQALHQIEALSVRNFDRIRNGQPEPKVNLALGVPAHFADRANTGHWISLGAGAAGSGSTPHLTADCGNLDQLTTVAVFLKGKVDAIWLADPQEHGWTAEHLRLAGKLLAPGGVFYWGVPTGGCKLAWEQEVEPTAEAETVAKAIRVQVRQGNPCRVRIEAPVGYWRLPGLVWQQALAAALDRDGKPVTDWLQETFGEVEAVQVVPRHLRSKRESPEEALAHTFYWFACSAPKSGADAGARESKREAPSRWLPAADRGPFLRMAATPGGGRLFLLDADAAPRFDSMGRRITMADALALESKAERRGLLLVDHECGASPVVQGGVKP